MRKCCFILFFISAKLFGQTPDTYVDQILIIGKDSLLAFEKYSDNGGYSAFQHLFLSTNDGVSWKDLRDSTPSDGKTIVLPDGSLLHGTAGDFWGAHAGLYHSTDLGRKWIKIRNSIISDVCASGINEYYIVVGLIGFNGGIQGNDSLLRSNDGGLTWKKIFELDPFYQSQINFVMTFQNKIFVNAYNKILRSEDYGKVWDTVIDISYPAPDSVKFAGAISCNHHNIFCQRLAHGSTSHSSIADKTSLLITSSGNSGSWVEGEVPFYKYPTQTGIPLVAKGDRLFTMGFLSCDFGKTWIDFRKNIFGADTNENDPRLLTAIAIDSSGKCFYGSGEYIVSTSDCGQTWKKVLLSLNNSSVNMNNDLTSGMLIFPNPASSSAQISYSLITPHYIKLSLVDRLGRVIQILRDTHQDSGKINISIPCNDLPDGMYYLRLENEVGSQFQKLIVAK